MARTPPSHVDTRMLLSSNVQIGWMVLVFVVSRVSAAVRPDAAHCFALRRDADL